MMKVFYIFMCILFLMSWRTVQGLQCPSCTYLTSDAEINELARKAINTLLNLFQDSKCAEELRGPVPEIKEETCESISGQVARCNFYKGSVTITVPLLVTSIDVPLQMYQRGCYHSKPANVPSNGCHDRDNINEDKTVIKQILDKLRQYLKTTMWLNLQGRCVSVQIPTAIIRHLTVNVHH